MKKFLFKTVFNQKISTVQFSRTELSATNYHEFSQIISWIEFEKI